LTVPKVCISHTADLLSVMMKPKVTLLDDLLQSTITIAKSQKAH